MTIVDLTDTAFDFSCPEAPLAHTTPEAVAAALRRGLCPQERAFDQFLPSGVQRASDQHWTPLVVARRAAQWLDEFRVRTVLDIGSGAGKFCVATALGGHCHFIGLEQRPRLVAASRTLAHTFGVEDRVYFMEGIFGQSPLPGVDAYYLYNPFDEAAFSSDQRIGEDVDLSLERRVKDIATVQELLRRAAVGTYLLTYNGFGGNVPVSYRELRVDRGMPQVLRLSRKVSLAARREPREPRSGQWTSAA